MTRAKSPVRQRSGTAVFALLVAAALWGAPETHAATEVRIEGNAAISTRHLREAAAAELAGLKDPARRQAAADDAAFQMEAAGRLAGYAFIDVEYAITGEDADADVVFRVREGSRVHAGGGLLRGERLFHRGPTAPAHRNGSVRPRTWRPTSAPARRELVQRYREQGFTDVKVGEPQITLSADRSVADVRFEIEEGTRFVIAGVVFEGDALPEAGPAARGTGGRPPGAAVLRASRAGARQSRDRGLRRAGLPGRRGHRA